MKKKCTKSTKARRAAASTAPWSDAPCASGPWGADAQLEALKQLPGYDVRAEQLRLLLKQMGVRGSTS